MKRKFYITSALPYVNSSPHLGHALEFTQADVLARYHRILGEDVIYLTGADEHGAKNVRSAKEAGVPVKKFVDTNSKKFQKLLTALNISVDYFVHTTDKKSHWPGAIKMWQALKKRGDIYKKEYRGFYCVGHEAFITQKDLLDGKCALHKHEPEVIEEENYFFRLSKYTAAIKEKVKNGEFQIIPKSSENELLSLLTRGLEDVSASRPSRDLKWGVPVPLDNSQISYVWLEALTSYISGLGYGQKNEVKFRKYWPADVQIIGKDILRFHAAIWPGMLLSAGLPLPGVLFVHGFIGIGGEKMSKSIGNVVDPFELVEKFGVDAVRYYLLREIPPTRDGDFTYEKFEERYCADLAKGLGNFTARVVNLGARHIKKRFEPRESTKTKSAIQKTWKRYRRSMGELSSPKTDLSSVGEFRFDDALQAIWMLIGYGDKFVAKTKLWELPQKDSAKFSTYIAELCTILATISAMVQPFLPATSHKIFKQLGIDPNSKKKWQFKLKKGKPLFPML